MYVEEFINYVEEYCFIVIIENIESNSNFYEANVKAVFLVSDFLLDIESEISLFSRSW